MSQIDELVIIDQAELQAVQPAPQSKNISLDAWIRKEICHREQFDSQYFDRNLVSVCLEPAIRSFETLPIAILDPQTQHFSVIPFKQTRTGACLDFWPTTQA